MFLSDRNRNASHRLAIAVAIACMMILGGFPIASSRAIAPVQDHPEITQQAPPAKVQIRNLSYAPGTDQLRLVQGSEEAQLLTVQVLQDGKPLPKAKVSFDIVLDPGKAGGGATLNPKIALTDQQGMARSKLMAIEGKGPCVVRACTATNEGETISTSIYAEVLASNWLLKLIINMIGGLALFLFGMELAGRNLQRIAGDKMRKLLGTMTRNQWSGALLGALATFLLQSSSASTVMLVGLVSATLLTLSQAMGVIIGAKVGTILTVQIISFNISQYSLLIIGLGLVLKMLSKSKFVKRSSKVVIGFGFLFFGMGYMSTAMSPLRAEPEFTAMMIELGGSPLLAIGFATIFTAVIQSSSATIGLAMALAVQGMLGLEACIPLAMGSAVGTCATAVLASLGSNREGKQVALGHLIYSVLSMLVLLPLLDPLVAATRVFSNWTGDTDIVRQIANGYSLYTLVAALLFLPFTNVLRWLTVQIVPSLEKPEPFKPKYLQESSLSFPDIAIEQAYRETMRMAELVRGQLVSVGNLILDPKEHDIYMTAAKDDEIDTLERAIRPFLAQVGRMDLNETLAKRERAILYIADTLENIGDIITKSMLHALEKMAAKKLRFSEEGEEELLRFLERVISRLDIVLDSARDMKLDGIRQLLERAEEEEWYARKLRAAHVERLHMGLSDTVTSSEGHLSIMDALLTVNRRITDIATIATEEMV